MVVVVVPFVLRPKTKPTIVPIIPNSAATLIPSPLITMLVMVTAVPAPIATQATASLLSKIVTLE